MQCKNLFKQKRCKSIKQSIKEITIKYFLNLNTLGGHRVLQINGNQQKFEIVDSYKKPTYCEDDMVIDKYGLYIKSKNKSDPDILNKKIISTCKEVLDSLSKLQFVNYGQKLNPYCLTVDTPNLVTVYSSGPVESTSSYFTNGDYTKFTATDTLTGKKTFDIEMHNNKDFNVLTATRDYITENGELIAWKGVYIDNNKSPGIVKLVVPKHAWIAQNTEGMKFRTNECKVMNIYKVKIYKCINCIEWAI